MGRCEDQEFLAAPAGDHVRVAQRFLQAFGDGDQHRVTERVAEAVVGFLEMVDVDQQQRLQHAVVFASPAIPLRPLGVHEVLEVAPVVESRQWVAAALHAELCILIGKEAIGDAQLAVKNSDHDEGRRKQSGEHPPHALAQRMVGKLGGLEIIFAAQKLDLPVAPFGFVFLLHFQQCALSRLQRDFVIQSPLAMVERQGALVVAELLEIAAIFSEQCCHIGGGAGAFVNSDGFVGQALALLDPAQAKQCKASVSLARGCQS